MALIEGLAERLRNRARERGSERGPRAPRLSFRFAGLGERLFRGRRALLLHAIEGRKAAPPEPAKILFPAAGGEQREDGEHRLGDALEKSVEEMGRCEAALAGEAGAVAAAITRRLEGETTLIAQAFRFLIACFWLFLSGSLFWMSRGGEASWAAWLGPIAQGDAAPLGLAFGALGGVALLAACLIAFSVSAAGAGDNKELRAKAARLGETAARFARDFDEHLSWLRGRMDGEKTSAAKAVDYLSRTHLTALEAAVFFRRVDFLEDEDNGLGDANARFRAFIGRNSPALRGLDVFAPAFLLGVIAGASSAFGLSPDLLKKLIAATPAPPIAHYPWAVAAITAGAALFTVIRLFIAAARGLFIGGLERRCYDEALEAFRSGYVGQKAPRLESVITRIEDALAIYKARLPSPSAAAASAALSAPEEVPPWRRPPEGPRFVETGFQAAPKAFLADAKPAPARAPRKKI